MPCPVLPQTIAIMAVFIRNVTESRFINVVVLMLDAHLECVPGELNEKKTC